jgi:hypothetical protein
MTTSLAPTSPPATAGADLITAVQRMDAQTARLLLLGLLQQTDSPDDAAATA